MGEAEGLISSAIPEQSPAGFSIEGDGKRFFLDEGEALDSQGEYPGFINFVGKDGKPERFAGGIFDKGENWQVLRFDAVGGEYLIPKAGGAPEVKPEAGEGVLAAPAEEAPVGGFEDAAAVAAMEAAPAEAVAPAHETAPVEAVSPAQEPAAEPELQPAPEPVPVLESAPAPEPEPAGLEQQPEITATPAETGRRTTVTEARQKFDQEFKDTDARARQAKYEAERKTGLEKQAQQLRVEAGKARNRVNKLKNKDRIAEAISEEGRLISEAKKLEGQAAGIDALEPDQIRAIEDRRQRARDLTQEIDRWGNLMENPALIEEYRGLDGRMQEDLAAAENLFGGGNPEDQQVLDAARKRIEGRTQARRAELQAMFPRRYMELAGMAPRQDLGEAEIDFTTLDRDLIEKYYQFADQFYAELTGQPQAAAAEIPVVSPTPELVPEPSPAPEVVEPPAVEQSVVQPEVEESAPAAEAVAEVEEVGQPEEVAASAVAEEAAPAPVEEPPAAPVEVPVEAPIPGEVVVDEAEQARAAAARQAEIPAAPVETEIPGEAAGTVEVSAPAEASAETPEQRFERRKQGFAGALAELDWTKADTSGTETEQKVRLAEAFNQAIGAAMEFMEEGDEAKAVVKEFLAGALGTSGGRKLTEIAVKSRMDNAGVFQATTPEERKKKLEETGLLGLLTLLLELGMSFTDKSVGAVVSEVQSATGGGK